MASVIKKKRLVSTTEQCVNGTLKAFSYKDTFTYGSGKHLILPLIFRIMNYKKYYKLKIILICALCCYLYINI